MVRRFRLVIFYLCLFFSYFLLVFTLCFASVGKSLARCLLSKASEDLVEKIISPVIFDTNRLKYSFKLNKQNIFDTLNVAK